LICPHCRFETLAFPCSQCAWEEVQAYSWAACEAEKAGKYEPAVGYWRQAVRGDVSDPILQRSLVSCLARTALKSFSVARFEEAASAFASTLDVDESWEEGHQLRILLFGRYGKLEDLRTLYGSQGEKGRRWEELVRLVARFREEDFRNQDPAFILPSKDWGTRLFFLVVGLSMTFWGSLWYKSSVEASRALFGPVFLIVFGLALAAGSAMINWNQKKKEDGNPSAPRKT